MKSLLRQEIAFIGIGGFFLIASVIGAVLYLPEISSQIDPELVRSEKSQHVKDPYGYPDKFIEYFAEIEGLNEGYQPYPHGSRMREFQRALLRNARLGKSSIGLDWKERGPGNVGGRTRAVVLDPEDPLANTWYVASVGGGVWRGQRIIGDNDQERIEWTPLTDKLPTLAATTLDISQSNPDIMYLGTGEGFYNIDAAGGLGMFKTTDKGLNWVLLEATAVKGYSNWRYINRLVIHPDNPDIVVAVTNGGIFRTEDGGQSFEKVYSARVQDLKVNPTNFNTQFAAVNGGPILRSTDGGKTWEKSFSLLVHGGKRIELAISASNPEVIWASVEGSGSRNFKKGKTPIPVADLYRSTDGGDTWRFLDRTVNTLSTFLKTQGWYDNTILVHPFSPDTVYIGGVNRFKAWVDGDRAPTTVQVTGVNSFNNSVRFMGFFNFDANTAGGRLNLGYLNSDADDDVQDIAVEDMVSVEMRFGPGLTQMAHRYTVPSNRGTGVSFLEYIYADYVEVPFQVWDTDNNRQLMVSFRDQAADGAWSLIRSNTSGPGSTHSREYIFISKYDYNASAPKPEFMENGGFRKGLMYFYWPYLRGGTTWDPSAPSTGTLDINFVNETIVKETYDIETWENDVVHVDHHAMIALPIDRSANEFYILNGNDGGIAYSRNGGENWREGDASPGFNTSQFYDATKRQGFDVYMGGMQDNGVWRSYNMANSRRGWRFLLAGDGLDVIWKGRDSLLVSSQYNNVWRSTDGWKSRAQAGIDNWRGAGDKGGQFLTSLSWTPKSGEAVFSISPKGGPLRSLDFGATWHRMHRPWIPFKKLSGKIRVSLADPSVVWGGHRLNVRGNENQGLLHVSENALAPQAALGVTNPVKMRPVNEATFAPPNVTISGLATHPSARATAYVMFSAYCWPKLIRTEDMGQTWEDLSGFAGSTNCQSSNGFPNARVYDIEVFPESPRIMWVGTDMGIFESRDHGETWSYADNGLPAVSVWRLRIVDDQVIVATHGRGVWSLDIAEVQTDIEQDFAALPESFELTGNYPNPFNPTTNINFKVGDNSHIRVTVFDVLGRKVATLTDQPYARGTHQIQWDASALSSGQYIYRMEADGKIVGAKSMALVK
ncbi:MAG: T9SS type A sorting domain-containing protein [Bacteroidetes bacterium]|nr:T9SS type A sorting domain-containing protein [Bacteroidota bacterium]